MLDYKHRMKVINIVILSKKRNLH